MSQQQTQVKILEIQVKYESAIKQLAQYKKQIEEVRNAQKDLKKQYHDGAISVEEYHQKMAAAEQGVKANQQAVAVLSRQVQSQMRTEREQAGSLNQLRAQLSKVTLEYDNMSRAEREGAKGQALKSKINAITAELKGAEEETQRFYRNVGNYHDAETGLGAIEEKAKGVGRAVLAFAGITGFGALLGSIKSVGSTFNDQMAKVKAVTNASVGDFVMMRQEAERLGSTTRYTATQAAEALENLTRNGMSAAQATAALGGVLELAQANAIELGEAADIVTNQINAFGLGVEGTQRVSDVMSKTCATSATDINLLAEAFKNVAPIASASNVPIEQVSAALGVLADRGVKGADAGTALKMAFQTLNAPTAKAQAVFDKYGITIDETVMKTDGLIGVLNTLRTSGIMESSTAMADLAQIFGTRAYGNVINLISGFDDMEKKLVDLQYANGTTRQMFLESYDQFTIAQDSLKSAWEGFQISLWNGDNKAIEDKWAARYDEIEKKKNEDLSRIQQSIKDDAERQAAMGEVMQEYNSQKQELYEGYQEDLIENGEGMSTAMIGPLKMLTEGIQWVKSNIEELGTLILSIIAGISLASLVKHVQSSARQMKASVISNAQAATNQVNTLAATELSQRQQVERLKVRYEQASGEERKLIANKLTVAKQQLAETEKTLTKAKTAEIKAMETAAAASTATGWKSAMLSAQLAVKGFVTASKVALKSFALTAILSLAIELIMKLWNAFSSGEGTIGKIGKAVSVFIKDALQKLGQVMVDVINWFIEFYNDSIIVRGAIALLGGVFKAVWAVLKAGVGSIINSFKLLGDVIGTAANVMKNFLSGNWGEAIKGIKGYGKAISDFMSAQIETGKNAGKEIAEGFVSSFNNIDKKLDKVDWKPIGSAPASSNGTIQNVTNNNSSDGKTSTDDEDADDNDNKGDKSRKKEEQLRKERELELKYANQLSQELYKIQEDGAEKRRQALVSSFDKRINELRRKLETEKNLSASARLSINKLIEVIEQEKADALVKLSKEEHEKIVKEEIANAEARLKLIRKNTGAILAEKLDELAQRKKAAIEAARDECATEAELQAKIVELYKQFGAERARLTSMYGENELSARLDILSKKHELEEQAAQDAIDLEKRKADELARMGKSQEDWDKMTIDERTQWVQQSYDAMSEVERANYDRQLQEATSALLRKQEALDILNEQYDQDQAALREESYAKSQEQQRQQLENDILELQNSNTERLLEVQNQADLESEQYAVNRALMLESIGGFEAQKLELERAAAEEAYNALLERGQLSTQTEDEFNAELAKKKEDWLAKETNINQAYIKQEEAKYQAMKSLTSSLTGLLDTLGESNKAFAMMSKVITLAQIAIDTGKAISAGVASASAVPFPGNIAAIATTVATVVANVATAISTVKSAKFAEGGKVIGPGTGRSDSIPAMLSNGEFVMTAAATRLFEPLLGTMNSIGSGVPMQVSSSTNRDAMLTDSLTESFTSAAERICPVVSVVEISDVQRRVKLIESIDNI